MVMNFLGANFLGANFLGARFLELGFALCGDDSVVVGGEPDAVADVGQFRPIAEVQSRRREIQWRVAQSRLDGVGVERAQRDAPGHRRTHVRFGMFCQQQQHTQKLPRAVGRVAIFQFLSQQREVGTERLPLKRSAVVQQTRLTPQQRQIMTRLQHVLLGYRASRVSRHTGVLAKNLDPIQVATNHARLIRMFHRHRVRTVLKPHGRGLVDSRRHFRARRERLRWQRPQLRFLFHEQLPRSPRLARALVASRLVQLTPTVPLQLLVQLRQRRDLRQRRQERPLHALHQVLDVPFFIPAGHVAEPRLKQITTPQLHELRVEIAVATPANADHRRLQIVIRQPLRNAPEELERPHMSVQKRDLILTLIRPHEHRATEREPHAKE